VSEGDSLNRRYLALVVLVIAVVAVSLIFYLRPSGEVSVKEEEYYWMTVGGNSSRTYYVPIAPSPPLEEVYRCTLEGRVVFPLVADSSRIYLPIGDVILCLNKSDFRELWRLKYSGSLLSPPTVSDSYLAIGGRDGSAILINSTKGEEIWSVPLESSVLTSPIITETSVIFTTNDGLVVSISKLSGELEWSYKLPGIISSPSASREGLYFSLSNGSLLALSIQDGSPLWIQKLGDVPLTSPIYLQNRIYVAVGSGYLCILDSKSGSLLEKLGPFGAIKQVSVGKDGIIVATPFEVVYVSNGCKVWRRVLPVSCLVSSPCRVYVTTLNGSLAVLSKEEGDVEISLNIGGNGLSWLAVESKRIYIITTEGLFVVFKGG